MRNWFGGLTLGQQIGAVGLVAITTVAAVPIYFINKGFADDIAFVSAERAGIVYQRPLVTLLEQVAEHQMSARGILAGALDLQPQVLESERKAGQALALLKEADAAAGELLQFTAEGLAKRQREHCRREVVEREWEELKSQWKQLPAGESDKRHAHLVSDIRTMIAHAGDTSNLILDSDLDSYYLMDALVVALPQTQQRLLEIAVSAGQLAAAGGSGEEKVRRWFALAAAQLKEADVDRVVADLQTALNEDQNFQGVSPTLQARIPAEREKYVKANKTLLSRLDEASSKFVTPATAAQLEASARAARQASLELWSSSATEMDILLSTRLGNFSSLRRWALTATGLALAISTLLGALVIRSTTRLLQSASQRILHQSHALKEASGQIASASQELARGSTDQAAAIEETSASTEVINSQAQRNASHSQQAARLTLDSEQRFADGSRVLDGMVEAMNGLGQESMKISKIIRVIDEIAFQTNILALNAAVEAARAGEAGMGFAVVADEVRNLAQRSAQAAKDTSDLIGGSLKKTKEVQQRVEQLVAAMAAIAEESSKVKMLVDSVSVGSAEQSSGIEQIGKALQSIGLVTQNNAATAQECAASVVALDGQSRALEDVVAELAALAGASADLRG